MMLVTYHSYVESAGVVFSDSRPDISLTADTESSGTDSDFCYNTFGSDERH